MVCAMTDTPQMTSITPVTWTTRRGIATFSFAVGLWSSLVFWWYPYSVFIATVGLVLGLVSLAMGWRAGKDGENLAIVGVLLCANTLAVTVVLYRGMQAFFGDLTTLIYP